MQVAMTDSVVESIPGLPLAPMTALQRALKQATVPLGDVEVHAWHLYADVLLL